MMSEDEEKEQQEEGAPSTVEGGAPTGDRLRQYRLASFMEAGGRKNKLMKVI